jgi:phage tail protein X
MPGLIVNQGPVEPRDYANARLIAAAPDLLEALKELLPDLRVGPHTLDTICNVRAAIAKAEGS